MHGSAMIRKTPQTTTASVASERCAGIAPEFVRVADAVQLFGVGKSTLADWISRGFIKSHLVRRQGNKSGMRLISTASLRAFIESHDSQAERIAAIAGIPVLSIESMRLFDPAGDESTA